MTPPSAKQITQELVQFVDEVAGVRIDHRAGLLASGLTSANLVALVSRAENRWQVTIPVEVLFHGGDLASLADHVRHALTEEGTAPERAGERSGRHTGSADDRKALRNRIRAAVGKIR